ncbi:MAG: hypothetical protein A2V79_07935 [Betaproteobacteria bacterium RBG_16_56_24]|nr:MAG: hypothetical protein A2V79_07935 [Betaproteobacteria bacterium RBG_16_56_24]
MILVRGTHITLAGFASTIAQSSIAARELNINFVLYYFDLRLGIRGHLHFMPQLSGTAMYEDTPRFLPGFNLQPSQIMSKLLHI